MLVGPFRSSSAEVDRPPPAASSVDCSLLRTVSLSNPESPSAAGPLGKRRAQQQMMNRPNYQSNPYLGSTGASSMAPFSSATPGADYFMPQRSAPVPFAPLGSVRNVSLPINLFEVAQLCACSELNSFLLYFVWFGRLFLKQYIWTIRVTRWVR